MSPATVELRNVTRRFGDVLAVDDVSLRVEAGEFLTLLGPSGCGKTTLLRIIAGLEQPSAGEVLIANEPMRGRAPYLRDCAIVFQQYALFPHRTVFENVAFGLRYRGVAKREHADRVHAMLELVRLPGLERRYPRELSGGQQQRVALARALVVRPSVLLLDEPLSNLDLTLREDMRSELRRLHERTGVTFIFVTHDQIEALSMSSRIAVMAGGQVVQLGTPADVYERPASRFVAEFIGRSNFLDGVVLKVGEPYVRVALATGLELDALPGCPVAEGDRVVVRVRADSVEVASGAAGSEVPDAWSARVTAVTYCGGVVEYQLRLSSGDELAALCPVARHEDVRPRDAIVGVRVRPRLCLVLEAAPA